MIDRTRSPRRRGRKILLWAAAGSACLLTLYACLPASILQYACRDETRSADAAIVLGAAVDGETPCPVFRERIRHGLDLFRSGKVRRLIFTGGRGRGEAIAEAEAARRMAVSEGIPPSAIAIETSSTTTWGNLFYAKAMAGQPPAAITALIVSDPFHMRRAMTMARDLGYNAFSSPTPTTRYRSVKSRVAFLKHEAMYFTTYLFRRTFGLAHPT